MSSTIPETLLALSVADLDARERGARLFKAGVAAVEAEAGPSLGPLARMLAARAVALATLADRLDASIASGKPVDPATYATLSNALVKAVGAFRAEADRDRASMRPEAGRENLPAEQKAVA